MCIERWKSAADRVTVESMGAEVVRMLQTMQHEMDAASYQRSDSHRILRSDTKAAIRKNMVWLRTKVSPWVDRLTALQRSK